jgi:hypothetical protein
VFETEWNNGVNLEGAITAGKYVLAASLSLPDTYLASDAASRVVFASLATDDGTYIGNVYRLDDYELTDLMTNETAMQSVAYNTDDDKMVAGAYSSNNVWRCSNPLAKEPDLYRASTYKRPGNNSTTTNLMLAWAGSSVVCGSSGEDSAYSKSTDDGKSFNDISMVDTNVSAVEDFAITDTGTWYIITNDGTDLSVWRGSQWSWARILTQASTTGYIIRIPSDDATKVYLADTAGTQMYYSSDSGDTTWMPRYCGVTLVDVVVESAGVIYAVDASGFVSRSDDDGFVWTSPATDSKLGSAKTLTSLGEDKLAVISSSGVVSYSKDGGESFSTTVYGIGSSSIGSTAQVVATGLETGDNLYAAGDGSNNIYRWTFGTNVDSWTNIGSASTGYNIQGLELVGSVLYAVSCNGSNSELMRNLYPMISETLVVYTWDSEASTAAFNKEPKALWISSGSTVARSVDTETNQVVKYVDTLTASGPTLVAPADATTVPVNALTGVGYPVLFSWESLSRATEYKLYVAYDEAFTQKIVDAQVVSNALLVSPVVQSTDSLNITLVPGTTYYWRVKASAPFTSPYSEKRTVTIQPVAEAEPEPEPEVDPTISGPAMAAEDVSIKPSFSWTAIPGATYEFVLAEDLGLDDPFEIIDYSATSDINAHIAREDLKYSTTYHWRVRAVVDGTPGDWVRGIFTTEAEPEEAAPPIIIEEKPAPPAPEIILEVPPTPAPVQVIPDYLLWVIVVVGAVLIIAVIVLIVRTRRVT